MVGLEPELDSTYVQAHFPSKGTSQNKRQHVGGRQHCRVQLRCRGVRPEFNPASVSWDVFLLRYAVGAEPSVYEAPQTVAGVTREHRPKHTGANTASHL